MKSPALRHWIPIATATTLLCALVYVIMQQNLRQNANYPQVQMAKDWANDIDAGKSFKALLTAPTVDMADSLSPFLIVVDQDGKVLASTAELNGKFPVPPKGVLDTAKAKGENRVTWQPGPGVRSAIIVVPYSVRKAGFVIAGRSLREIEVLQMQLLVAAAVVWALSLIITLLQCRGAKYV